MNDPNVIAEEPDRIKTDLARRLGDPAWGVAVDRVVTLSGRRRDLIVERDTLRAELADGCPRRIEWDRARVDRLPF